MKIKISKTLFRYIICIFIFAGMLMSLCIKKNDTNPIIVGFSAQLTGNQAENGVQQRNAAQLAIEKINSSGGIDGRKIYLAVKDDQGTAEGAKSADRELIKKGVVAIIGHVTSVQTLAGVEVTNPAKVIMIAPTVSTPKLNEQNDYFFRISSAFTQNSKNYAKYIYKQKGLSKIAVIYDQDNYEYTKLYSDVFTDQIKILGGNITDKISFSSAAKPDFHVLISKLQESNADALFIVASDIDTALIAQRARLMGWQVPMFTSSWAQTETLIRNGGKAVEGMYVGQSYDINNQSSDYIEFKKSYKKCYSKEPSTGAIHTYEAMMVLYKALKKTDGNKKGLKKALLEIHKYKGLVNDFSFDKFGDVNRPWYLSTIHNGKFVMVNDYATK